jgi:branched-chain amino acid transport system substrate-binding protein
MRTAKFCILALMVVACSKTAPDTVRIGAAGPLTGDQSVFGQDQINGVNLAIDEWNSRGGLLGKKISLVFGDDQHDPKQAVSVANKMVNEKVAGVVGHFNSSCSIPSSTIYHEAGIPMITHGSTNPKLTEQGFKNVFRVCGRDDQQGRVAADYVKKVLVSKKVAIIHDKTTYGQGLAEEFKKAAEGMGVEVAWFGGIVQGDKDYTAVLTDIREKAPDLVYFGGIYPEAGQLVKQAKSLKINAPFMSGDGVIGDEFIKIAGQSAAEGTYVTFSPDLKKLPSAKGFLDSYTAKFGAPGPYSVYAYVAANILFEGIKNAGTTEAVALTNALAKTKYGGALGEIEFDVRGDVKKSPYVMWVVKNGKYEQISE